MAVNYKEDLQEKMSDYVPIADSNQGWNFFTKRIKGIGIDIGVANSTEFSFSEGDWLDADNQKRKIPKEKTKPISLSSKGRIFERDGFSDSVCVTVGSRFFNLSRDILWVSFEASHNGF